MPAKQKGKCQCTLPRLCKDRYALWNLQPFFINLETFWKAVLESEKNLSPVIDYHTYYRKQKRRKCLQMIANLWYLPLQTITNTITIVWNVWHTIDLFVSLHVWCNVQIIWQHETIQNVEFYMKSKSFWKARKNKLLIQSFQL